MTDTQTFSADEMFGSELAPPPARSQDDYNPADPGYQGRLRADIQEYHRRGSSGPRYMDIVRRAKLVAKATGTTWEDIFDQAKGFSAGETFDAEKSKGHIAFIDDVELFKRANGDLYRAPISDVIMPDGYRSGRWEAYANKADERIEMLTSGFSAGETFGTIEENTARNKWSKLSESERETVLSNMGIDPGAASSGWEQLSAENQSILMPRMQVLRVPRFAAVRNFCGELSKGIEVEKEHTDDPKVAEKIARDHLREDPEYYTKLAKMESTFSAGEMFNGSYVVGGRVRLSDRRVREKKDIYMGLGDYTRKNAAESEWKKAEALRGTILGVKDRGLMSPIITVRWDDGSVMETGTDSIALA
jgi:hypothetical protein